MKATQATLSAKELNLEHLRTIACKGIKGEIDKWTVYDEAWGMVDAGQVTLAEALQALGSYASPRVLAMRLRDHLAWRKI